MRGLGGLCAIGLVLTLVPATAAARVDDRAERIDRVFRSVDTEGDPGCVVGIGERGKTVFARGYGAAEVDGARLTRRSVLEIASISKQMTAAITYMLVEEGKLDLSADIRTYVPELPDYGTDISLDSMIHHTSGLPDYSYLLTDAVTAHTTTADAIEALAENPDLDFRPDTRYEYSNTNYMLLAVAAEHVTGQSFRSLVTQRIFEPLGMRSSLVRDDADELIPHGAIGYAVHDEKDGDVRFENTVSGWEQTGDGSVNTTVVDLLRWANNFSTWQVGGQELRDAMLTPGPLPDEEGYAYGGGVSLYKDFGGRDVVEHTGSWAGYESDLTVLPKEGLAVTVLCNREDVNPYKLGRRTMAIWLRGR